MASPSPRWRRGRRSNETSIYRRWGTTTALALDSGLHFADTALPVPDTGSLRSDLAALLEGFVTFIRSPQGAALPALSASRHPEVIAVRRNFFRQRFALTRTIFDKAILRGEFPADAAPMAFLESLIAPLYLRVLVTGEPLEDWPRNDMIDLLLAAYRARGK